MNQKILQLIVQILNLNSKGMSFTVKYFLIRILIVYGVNKEIQENMKDLISCLGMSDREIKKARDWLVKQGYLLSIRERPSGAGSSRPIEGFSFNQDWLASLLSIESQHEYPKSIRLRIWELFVLEGQSSRSRAAKENIAGIDRRFCSQGSHNLRSSNRVLLGVMLLHASEFGVVERLGLGTLGRLAGMLPDKVKSQINTLTKKGYIRRYIPGGTSKKIFGVFSGVYLLDLNHPDFRSHQFPVTLCLFGTNEFLEASTASEAKQLNRMEFWLRSKKLLTLPVLHIGPLLSYETSWVITDKYHHALEVLLEPAAVAYLQFYIDSICSRLLSMKFDKLEAITFHPREPYEILTLNLVTDELENVTNRITPDIGLEEDEERSDESKKQYALAAELICTVALRKARLFKTVLLKMSGALQLPYMSFQIMPTMYQDGRTYTAILCFMKNDINRDWSYVFVSQGGVVKVNNLKRDKLTDVLPTHQVKQTNTPGSPAEVIYLEKNKSTWVNEDILYQYGLLTKVE